MILDIDNTYSSWKSSSISKINRILSATEAEALARDLTVGEALDVQELLQSVKLRWNKQIDLH